MNPRSIRESDWKIFRELRTVALDRFCGRVLSEIASLSADSGQSAHERYLAVYDLIKQRDKKLAVIFDGLSRSRACLQLASMQHEDLLKEDEMARFSPELREEIQQVLRIGRP